MIRQTEKIRRGVGKYFWQAGRRIVEPGKVDDDRRKVAYQLGKVVDDVKKSTDDPVKQADTPFDAWDEIRKESTKSC